MLRFGEEVLFDDMCKFVAEPRTIEFFMVGGDVRGSWKSALAQLFTRTFLEAISPEVLRYACTSQLIVNADLYSQPMDLFLMVERQAKNWPTTHRLLVHSSMSVGRQMRGNSCQSSVENLNSHRNLFNFSTSMNPRNNGPRFCPSSGDKSFRTAEIQVELFRVRPAKVCKGLEAHVFLLDVISTPRLYTMAILGR